MAKRKLDTDDSSDSQNAEKKHKFSGWNLARPAPLFGFERIKLIDFTNIEDRKKYHPDVDIISGDLTVLKYHKCKMAEYQFFDHIINECSHEQNMCRIELKTFDSHTINIMLNYIEIKHAFNVPRYLNTKQIANLYSLAHYCDLKSLQNICCQFIETEIKIDKLILDCYTKYKLKDNALFGSVLSGRFIHGTEFSQDFLRECFNYGMERKVDGVIIYLLELYCPTDEQMKLFMMGEKVSNSDKKQTRSSSSSSSSFGSLFIEPDDPYEGKNRLKRFMNGNVSKETIDTFFAKYNKDNNSPGVNKLMRSLAWMCFMD